jgi:hypothetical protein
MRCRGPTLRVICVMCLTALTLQCDCLWQRRQQRRRQFLRDRRARFARELEEVRVIVRTVLISMCEHKVVIVCDSVDCGSVVVIAMIVVRTQARTRHHREQCRILHRRQRRVYHCGQLGRV